MTSNEKGQRMDFARIKNPQDDPVQLVDIFENSKDHLKFDGHRLSRNRETIQ